MAALPGTVTVAQGPSAMQSCDRQSIQQAATRKGSVCMRSDCSYGGSSCVLCCLWSVVPSNSTNHSHFTSEKTGAWRN